MKNILNELKDLIDYIQSVYAEVTTEWLESTPYKNKLKEISCLRH